MEKPPIRKASRALNLTKPAPRKNGLIQCSDTVSREETCTAQTWSLPEKNEKENKIGGKRAMRCLKLDKPAPLKLSKINKTQDENCTLSTSVKQSQEEIKSMAKVKEEDIAKTEAPAEMKAKSLIKEALAELEDSKKTSKPPSARHCQTRLLSQVSMDSGLGDMSSYSRQGSLLENLSEKDDLDWNDIDDSATTTFSFGSEHLKCLAYTVNQIQPYNSILCNDDIQVQSQISAPKQTRHRKFSQQNKCSVRDRSLNSKLTRSYSVPASLTSNRETEFWDEEIDHSFDDLRGEETVERLDSLASERNLSVQNSTDDLNGESARRDYQIHAGNKLNEEHTDVFLGEEYKQTKPDTRRFSFESWESEEEEFKYIGEETARASTPVNGEYSFENNSAMSCCGTDPDSTPKAESVLLRFSDLDKTDSATLDEKQQNKNESKDDSTELFVNEKSNKSSAKVMENCDITSAMMKNLPSYQNYRESLEADVISSVQSSTDTDDHLSSCTSEDSFNLQMYAWELIEDLSDRVNSLKLDKENLDKDPNDILKEIPSKFVVLPEDIDAIEKELDFMREDLDLSESFNSVQPKYVHSVLKTTKSVLEEEARVKVSRQPLSPYSPQEEVWKAEEGMQTGFFTAKGRRGMFRYYRQSQTNEEEKQSSTIIQYPAEELLRLGTSPLSKKKPDSWCSLEKVHPDICLNKVATYFDAEGYLLVRDYVVEVQNVLNQNNRKTSFNAGARETAVRFPDVNKAPSMLQSRGGSGDRKGGFGTPVKQFTCKPSSEDVQEVNLVPNQMSTIPVKKFENEVLKSNEKHLQKSYDKIDNFGKSQVNNEKLNLDNKCDVSIRNEGSLRFFEAAISKILPTKPAREFGVKRSISDPEGERLSFGRDYYKNVNNEIRKSVIESRKHTSFRGYHDPNDGDLVLKKDLPEACPW